MVAQADFNCGSILKSKGSVCTDLVLYSAPPHPSFQGIQQQKHIKASPTCFTLKMSFPSCTAGTPRMASTSMLHSTSQLPQKRQRSSSITCLPHNRPHPPYLLPAQVLARTHGEIEDRKYTKNILWNLTNHNIPHTELNS